MSETPSVMKALRSDNLDKVSEPVKHEDQLLREVSQILRSWEKFLASYCCNHPMADINDPVQLEILNAKWLHKRERP